MALQTIFGGEDINTYVGDNSIVLFNIFFA